MNPADLDRVEQARGRLRSASMAPNNDDRAIRLVELISPRFSDPDLELHRQFSIISGLGVDARQAVADTLDGLRSNDPTLGLSGIVEVWGRRQPLHASQHAPSTPGTSLLPGRAFVAGSAPLSGEAEVLAEVVDAIDRAVLLSGAELRGADAALLDLRQSDSPATQSTSLEVTESSPLVEEARRTLAAIDQVVPTPEISEEIRRALRDVESNPDRVRLEARRSQAQGARAQILPGDSRHVAMLADLAIAEADGELAEYDIRPDSPAHDLAITLELLDIHTSPAEAPTIANQILEECAELEAIRGRAIRTIEQAFRAADPEQAARERDLERIENDRRHIQRRLRSQQQLLAISREQWATYGIGDLDLRNHLDLSESSERPLPILVEEPLADLPIRLAGAILSTLLRHSTRTQVICLSDQRDLQSWCESVGDRVGWVDATDWLEEEVV